MTKVPLGSTGLLVSPIGYAGSLSGSTENAKQANVVRLLSLLDGGVNLIETAGHSEVSEEHLSDALKARRDRLVILARFSARQRWGNDLREPSFFTEEDLDRSLLRLKTDRIEVAVLQHYDGNQSGFEEALAVLVRAKEKGKVLHFGYCGDNDDAIVAVANELVSVLQISISIVDQHNLWHALPLAKVRSLGVLAMRPLGYFPWQRRDAMPPFLKQRPHPYHARWNQVMNCLESFGMTARSTEEWALLALRFTLSQPGVHSVILSNNALENLGDNIPLIQPQQLNPAFLAAVTTAFEGAEYASGQPWCSPA